MPLSRRQFLFPFIATLLLGGSPALRAQNPVPTQAEGAGDVDEAILHEGKWIRSIEADLIAEKFDDLDRMADEYRRERSRLPGGEWRLRVFYTALDAPQMTDKDSIDHLAHLEHWMKARPESITARVAYSTSLHRWAWVARGNGEVNTVTPEGWRLFNERINLSAQTLIAATNLHTMCPQWFSEVMTVGLAQNWDEKKIKDVFERGIQFERDYYYLYRQYANYLLPKWDGAPGDSSKFAKNSADKLGGEAGDIVYYQIATVLISRHNNNYPVKQMDWARIQRGYAAITTQYGGTKKLQNELAFMAWKYRDQKVAKEQLATIGDNWSRGVWGDQQKFDRARDWSLGHGG